jgi:hypothetical protein
MISVRCPPRWTCSCAGPRETYGCPMDGGIQRLAGSSDAELQRSGDVATAHSTDACAEAPPDEIFNLGIRRPRNCGRNSRRSPGISIQ